jgi:hypothetical protein
MVDSGSARERSFGVSVGGALLLLSGALVWRGHPQRAEVAAVVALFLITAGLLRPTLLTSVADLWWRFAHALGFVNSRVLLTIFFFGVLVPVGFVWRLTGRDPLDRRRDRWRGWSPHPERYRDPKHYARMF